MDGSYIHYTYDAAGTLLRKGYYVGEELTEIPGDDEEELTGFRLPDTHLMSVGDEEEEKELVEEEEEEIPYTDVIDYCGNCIYENGTLRRIFVEGGYITFDSSNQPVYHFYLKDHLGNNRVVANASGQAEQVNHYYPYGGLMAESTCGDVQRYKYNGKELDRMLGLDWYDYGARHYDGALTTWGTVDPLCENYYNISPYVYCGNNPINAFDPDGRDVWEINSLGHIENHIETTDYDMIRMTNGSNIRYEYGTIKHQTFEKKDGSRFDMFTIYGDANGKQVFETLAQNTVVEWGLGQFGDPGDAGINKITTSNSVNSELNLNYYLLANPTQIMMLRNKIHNHPNGDIAPSFPSSSNKYKGDVGSVRFFNEKYKGNKIRYSIYTFFGGEWGYYPYDDKSNIQNTILGGNQTQLNEIIIKGRNKR